MKSSAARRSGSAPCSLATTRCWSAWWLSLIHIFQSNHEGAIVDRIQAAYQKVDGIVINPAAYTHTSVAILDALKAVSIPACEVHLTDVNAREDFRKVSYVRMACDRTFAGFGFDGYRMAMEYLVERYGKPAE